MNYPFEAIEEALANAVYHKNYELREPIEVRILPEAIEIISFGGPEPSIRIKDLNEGIVRSRRYRNRRIGEFLKELNMTEGKGTGIPTIKKVMEANGSPHAKYDTDGDERRFFVTELPVHPHFLTESELPDKGPDKGPDKLNNSQIAIIDCLRKNKNAKLDNISEVVGISERHIRKNIKVLVELGIIKRVGSRKTGYWEIIDVN